MSKNGNNVINWQLLEQNLETFEKCNKKIVVKGWSDSRASPCLFFYWRII